MTSAPPTIIASPRENPDELPAIRRLLAANGLPDADVAEHLPHFLVARQGETLVGTVAIEPLGDSALLRSLAVVPELRGQGLARQLYERIVARARELGVRRLYLLTTSADDYFLRLGFWPVERDAVPPAVRGTRQFARSEERRVGKEC